jgi:RNA polymerase sigma factor (sigma-70 family)
VELVQISINPESSQIEARLTTDRLLSALREKDRYAVVSYFFAGLKLKEIGRRLGVSEGRVSQRVNNSLRLMRQNGISVRRPDGP